MKIEIVKEIKVEGGGYQQMKLESAVNLEPSTCDEIIVGDILDYTNNKGQVFQQLVSKLKYNGIINLSGISLDIICNEYNNGQLTPYEMTELLYNGKTSTDTLYGIINMCQHYGLEIILEDITQYKYIVSAKKVKNE